MTKRKTIGWLLGVLLIATALFIGALAFIDVNAADIEIGNDAVTQVKVGEKTKIAELKLPNPDMVTKINSNVIFNSDNSQRVLVDGVFRPEQVGAYTVSYTVEFKDGGRKSLAYGITAIQNKTPVFFEKASLPNAFVAGKEYFLSQLEAYDYSAQKAKSEVNAFVDGSKISNGKFTALPNTDFITVKYVAKAKSAGFDAELVYDVPVIKVDYSALDMTKFFLTENATAQAQSDHMQLDFKENGIARFANIIDANSRIVFTVTESKNSMQDITVRLTDSADDDISIALKIIKGKNADAPTLLSINGGSGIQIAGSFYGNSNYDFMLDLNNFRKELADARGEKIAVVGKDENGRVFNGFPSNAVKLEILTGGVVGGAQIKLKSINYQTFSNATLDGVDPAIRMSSDFSMTETLGKELEIKRPLVFDVLDPSVTLKVTIMCPSGIVTGINGDKYKDFEFVNSIKFLPQVNGNYMVDFVCSDSSDNSISYRRLINVIQKTTPIFNFDKNNITDAKMGADYQIAKSSPTAEGSLAEEIKLYIVLYKPNGKVVQLSNGANIKFEDKGTYFLRYSAYDKFYNAGFAEFVIKVEN